MPPDLTQFVLDTLATQGNGGNWNTANADHPIRYDRRNGERLDTGERTTGVDLVEDVVVSVGTAPRDREPIGTEYDVRYRDAAIPVRLEGVHVDQRGTVDPSSGTQSWQAYKDELERALDAERTFPTSDSLTLSLLVQPEADLSDNLKDSYRAEWSVIFDGFENL